MDRYSALTRLFGAYLNQDVFDVYPDEFVGAADFASDDPDDARVAADEIALLLRDSCGDTEIEATLTEMGVEIRPIDLTYREWLTRIAEVVRAATERA